MLYVREDPATVVKRLDDPFLVGFSTYLWNFEYSKELAAKIKDAYPSCIILFGGHQIPPDDTLLHENAYIDI
jgi:hypothetical protein